MKINQSNIKVTFLYVEIKVENLSKRITLVTTNKEDAYSKIIKEENDLLNIEVNLLSEESFKINKNKDPLLFNEVLDFFKENNTLKYNDVLSFDGSLDEKSFVKEVLFKNNKYVASNDFEKFLSENNILKAYYNKEINFKVKVDRLEYSSEFGEKHFNHTYDTTKLDWDVLNKMQEKIMDVYVSQIVSTLLSFNGVDDNGNKVTKALTSSNVNRNKL